MFKQIVLRLHHARGLRRQKCLQLSLDFHFPEMAAEQALFSISFVVVGGGLSGLATAISLKRVGHNVVVLEKDAQIASGGVGIGCRLAPNATKILQKWGIIGDLEKRSKFPLDSICFYKWERNEELGEHTYEHDVLEECGGEWLAVSHPDLRGFLYEQALKIGVEVRTEALVTAIDPDERIVTLEDGSTLTGDIIIAADGSRGLGREVLLGTKPTITPGDYAFYSTNLSAELIPQIPEIKGDVEAHSDAALVMYGDGLCLYTYPITPQGDLAIHIFHYDGGPQPGVDDDSVVDLGPIISSRTKWLSKLAALTPPAVKHRNLEFEDLEEWVHDSERFLVIGEAAHPFSEGSLQSYGMLLEDAAVLGKLFSYLKSEDQIAPSLWGFQDLRQSRCQTIQDRERYRVHMFTLTNGPEQEARDKQARLLDKVPGADLGLYSLEEPRVIFAYDTDEQGEEWWQSWGLLRERAQQMKQDGSQVEISLEVRISNMNLS